MKISQNYLNRIINEELEKMFKEAPVAPERQAGMKQSPSSFGTIIRNIAAVGVTSAVITAGSVLGSKINQIDPAQRSILASQDVRNKLSSADQLELMALLNALPSRDFEVGKAKLFFADLAVLQIDVAGLGLKLGRYLKIKKPMDSALQKVSPVQLQVLELVAFYEIAQSPAIVSRSGSALEFAEVVSRSANAGATVASAPIDNFLARAGLLEKADAYIESMTVR